MINRVKSRMLQMINICTSIAGLEFYNKKNIMKEVNKKMAYIIVLGLLLVASIVMLLIAGKHIIKKDPT
ncbi:hypothetical protein NV377_07930 [Paenibacillus sp. T3-5-0-4]|nr:hypothetical protein [Paenibacillus endoradicis]